MSCDTKPGTASQTDSRTNQHQFVTSSQACEELVLTFDEQTDHHRVYFHEPERHNGRKFCWSQPLSLVRMDVPAGRYQVTIDTASVRGDRCKFPFEIRWNDHRIVAQAINIEEGKISFFVDESVFLPNDEQRLTISCRPLSSVQDKRLLGMPIASIRLAPTNHVQTSHLHREHIGHWMKQRSAGGLRQLLGKTAPSPLLPIWDMKLANIPTQISLESAANLSQGAPAENVLVSCVEINSRHGTGLLIQYLFDDFNNLTTLCSKQIYGGERVRSRVHYDLPNPQIERHEIYAHVLNWFREAPPKRAYVVPIFDAELLIANAMKDLFGTKICLHFMDDQNVHGSAISDAVLNESLTKADLTFAISPEMRTAYQHKFGQKIHILPPIVPEDSIQKSELPENVPRKQRGILIGNIWDSKWLDRLRKTVRESDCEIDWFCNNPNAVMDKQQLSTLKSELEVDGIFLQDALWGDDLIEELRRRPYALMPSGTLDKDEETANIARLSLPSRIPFMISTARLPVIVLGSPDTAAAKFVDRFQLGQCVSYEGTHLKAAIESINDPKTQATIRKSAARIGPQFSNANLEEWLWESVEQSEPIDNRFEEMFEVRDNEFAYFIDAEAPTSIHWEKRSLWQSLKRLKTMGIQPETIIDVGASNGVWSWSAGRVFPNAHFVMVEPLLSYYPDSVKEYYHSRIDRFQLIEAALSDQSGETEFLVSDDLFGSSLLKVNENIRDAEKVKVEVLTMDELASQNNWAGPILLKIDVQYAEHLVIAGGANFIQSNVDALILELTIEREHPDAKTYREMLDLMDQLGYQLVDETEGWRNPRSGVLEQKDSVFIRRDLLKQLESGKESNVSC